MSCQHKKSNTSYDSDVEFAEKIQKRYPKDFGSLVRGERDYRVVNFTIKKGTFF